MKKSVYIIIPILTLCLGACGGYMATNYFFKENTSINQVTPNNLENTTLPQTDEASITKEFYSRVKGEYLCKLSSGSAYGKVFDQNASGEYTYLMYLMHSGGSRTSVITNVTKKSDNEYLVNYYSEAYEDMEGSGPEIKSYMTIDISKLTSGLLIVDGQEYKKFNGAFNDWDAKDEFIGYYK